MEGINQKRANAKKKKLINDCTKFGYNFVCMMDCNKYYIVRCKQGHLTKKIYNTLKNGCNECKVLKGINNLNKEAVKR